jgi:undecaprenyl-diphosphatase
LVAQRANPAIIAPFIRHTMPDWLYAIIYGLVEGITEFIPVSSTGHLLITEKLLHHKEDDVFNIFIQSGAVLAIVPLFWKKISGMLFEFKKPANFDWLIKLIVAFGITGAIGFVVDKKGFKLPEALQPVAWALLIGGIVIFVVEAISANRRLTNQVTWAQVILAFGIGQIVAGMLPGASRSGTTIMVAMLMGLARPVATEFSFILGVPTLMAAGLFKLFKAYKAHELHLDNSAHLAIGTVVSAIVSFIVVRWLIHYVQRHTFNGFAIYRVLAGGALLAAILMGWLKN